MKNVKTSRAYRGRGPQSRAWASPGSCRRGLRWKTLLALALIVLGAGRTSFAADAYPFTKGSARVSVLLGGGTAFDKDYTVLGIGGGYYVADGLEVGLEAEAWEGNAPRIYRITPGVTAVLYTVETVRPYGGIFYRRAFISGYRDTNDAGARAGGLVPIGQRAYFGAGVVYDAHLNCDRKVYSSCSDVYPEIMITALF